MPQARDPMILIGELLKVLNLYINPGVTNQSNMNNNFNARVHLKGFRFKNLNLIKSF